LTFVQLCRSIQEKVDCTYTSSVQCQKSLNIAVNGSVQVVLSKYQAAVVCANPCKNKPCANNGACTANGYGYQCACPIGYSGLRCEVGQLIYAIYVKFLNYEQFIFMLKLRWWFISKFPFIYFLLFYISFCIRLIFCYRHAWQLIIP